jgi:NAD(P)-dependent dehydrogenase (short-subunit alcohol dehydrogenase family)
MMARNAEKLKAIQTQIEQNGGTALSISANASDLASVTVAFSQVKQLGDPEVFIYNTGAFQIASVLEITTEQFEYNWKANCFGAFLGVQQVLPAMLERGSGTILFTGATAAMKGSAKFAGFAVGKFGLRALAQSLAGEFGPQGIHVAHIVIDGIIDTPRVRQMMPNREQQAMLSPEAIAETYLQLYLQDSSAWTLEMDLRPAVETF